MNSVLDVMSAIGSLVIICLVIALTYYVSRWYARRAGVSAGGKYVKVLDRTHLGNTSSLMIIQVGGKYYLLGVSDKNMEMLCELEDFDRHVEESSMSDSAQAPFGQLLRGLMDKSGTRSKKRDDGGSE